MEHIHRPILTIGHSTLPIDAFIGLLTSHGVVALADVRTIPRSRRHPQFGAEALARSLAGQGIVYRHFPGLGGLRKPRPDSANTAWQHPGFRGYADYMQTAGFAASLEDLLSFSSTEPAAVMCAEARWWQCHRRLLADALVARGVEVRHIMGAGPAEPHHLTPFARVQDGQVRYPGLI